MAELLSPGEWLVIGFNRTLVHSLTRRIEDRYGKLAWGKLTDAEGVVRHFEAARRCLPSLKRLSAWRRPNGSNAVASSNPL